jgi:hypothetical protein
MSHEIAELRDYPLRRLDAIPRGVLVGAAVLAVIGLVIFIISLVSDPDRAWRAYLFNWVHFAGLAQGAVLLGAVVSITRGVWSRPIRRIALSFVAFLPIAYLILFPPILIFADHILPWIHEGTDGRDWYLNMPFLATRNLIALGALLVLSLVFAYWQLRPDMGLARDAGWTGHDRLTRGWTSQEMEEERSFRRLAVLGPALALAYVVAFTFIAIDLIMSLDPHWLSMLIAPYVFMAAFLGGIAATVVLTLVYRRHLALEAYVEGATLHDLGKLLFGYCVFWAYLFWSQYIVIWYGNLPYEQVFLVPRVQPPYLGISLLVLFSLFVLPFAGLLGATAKKTPAILGGFSLLVLAGLWFERYLLVYPTLYPDAEALVLGLPELGPGLFMLGLLMAAVGWFGTRFPLIQIWRPASEVELLGVTVVEDEEPRRL